MKRGSPAPVLLVVDKPPGRTSHDIVALLRAVTGVRRCGHTGTLDPFATGVLAVAFGAATRFISFFPEDHKVYEATLQLGAATRTGDLEGEVCETAPVPVLTDGAVAAAMAGLTGPLLQVPPAYSAIKVEGRPLYSYAREGIAVTVPPRPIRVDRWEPLPASAPGQLRFRVTCGKGTYVRTLGEDLARALGTVGHLVALRRCESGPFTLDQALSLDALAEVVTGRADAAWGFPTVRGVERPPRRDRAAVRAALKPHLLGLADAFPGVPRLRVGGDARARLFQAGLVPPLAQEGLSVIQDDDDGAVLALASREAELSRALRVVSPEGRSARW